MLALSQVCKNRKHSVLVHKSPLEHENWQYYTDTLCLKVGMWSAVKAPSNLHKVSLSWALFDHDLQRSVQISKSLIFAL